MKRAIPRTLALLLSGLVIFSATTFAQTFQPQTRLACDKAADHRFRIARHWSSESACGTTVPTRTCVVQNQTQSSRTEAP